jgi:hypothetical protein
MSRPVGWLALVLCAGLVAAADPVQAQGDDEAVGFERTPPRLGFLDGDVSFWRPGAEEWTRARVNTALAAGDELYAGEDANLELQVGPRAFVRAGENTELGLTGLEPDYLQLRLTEGTVSLDLRSLGSGQSFEIGTPNAAFGVERSGYYRVEVEGDTTTFTSRRGGRATVTPATGEPVVIAASEQVVVAGSDAPQLESYAAPELDAWDRWNYARTDDQLDSVSARYVAADVYGAYDLDPYGTWRVVPTYGAVWVPRHVRVGWVPYSAGRWMWDPWYGWTWVDDAPWGWAPFHYGRWVYVSGYWGWCPGPLVVRPYYAPALVAFYGGGDRGVRFGRPYLGWVALGWGEPLIPWWGPSHFRRHAHWAGWGGPRIVNQVVVRHRTVYPADEIHVYQHAGLRNAMLEVERDRFGRRGGEDVPFRRAEAGRLSPLASRMDVGPDRSSLVAEMRPARRPPEAVRSRAVVATRAPRLAPVPELDRPRVPTLKPRGGEAAGRATPDGGPPPRMVTPPQQRRQGEVTERAPFGKRGEIERATPPPAPRYHRPGVGERDTGPARASPSERRGVETRRGAPSLPERVERHVPGQVRERPEIRVPGVQQPSAAPALPGEPANRVYRLERSGREGAQHPAAREAERGGAQQPGGVGRSGSGFGPRGRGPGR